MKNIIAVTIGDINGIGIELLIKVWKANKFNNFILITNSKLFKKYLKKNKISINILEINNQINELYNLNYKNKLNIYNINAKNNDQNTYNSLITSYNLVKYKFCIGILTLPLNKKKINQNINIKFLGQTEFFTKKDKKKYSNMMFLFKNIIFVSLTTHISLNKINKYLGKQNYIYNKLLILLNTFQNDFKINNPKFLISGINPHAGEEGLMGNEENKYIIPAIKKINRKKIIIDGPISADSIVNKNNIEKYDCIIFNYHDQTLIPFKMLSKFSGINYTSGLDIIRVSPDFGTAYNIIGKNIAKTDSIINCFNLIKRIYENRK